MGKQISGAQKRKKKKEKEELAAEMERLKLGPTKLWTGLVLHQKDVFTSHVLPKLNETDRFFFAGASGGSWEVLAYAKVLSKLSWNIYECSSISTLEFAWNNMEWGEIFPCGNVKDQVWFCEQAAKTNKLELLKWAREVKQCKWNEWTIKRASDQGNLEMVKYCVANECPIDGWACKIAASGGQLEMLKYLHEEGKAPWDSRTADWVTESGHLHILEYLVERKFDKYRKYGCEIAAKCGHLDCLKYLHETAKAPWDYRAVRYAHENNHPECLQYLLDNDCPLPQGWRYEHGELHTS